MKLYKQVLLFLMLLSQLGATAAHILGGDMSVQHVSDSIFSVRLQLFRDLNSGGATLDPTLTVFVYEEGTDILQPGLAFNMTLGQQLQPELGDDCFSPDIAIEIGVYEEDIILPPNPNGYYLVWERCCRSENITNLFDPGFLGIVFVATVPDPTIENSSPQFEEYPADGYFCVNTLNQFAYQATDADGDSLAYALEAPLYGELAVHPNFGDPNPGGGGPKPTHHPFDYVPPYSLADPIGGTPFLSIDNETGLITGSPTEIGFFSFAVRVDEFRDGVKIGEIRREITLESTLCDGDVPPNFAGFDTYDTLYLNAFFENEIFITIEDNATDTVWQTFSGEIFDGVYDITATFDTLAIQDGLFAGVIHWDSLGCEYVRDEPYNVYFLANSIHECTGVPSTDTLYLSLIVQLPEDVPTQILQPFDFTRFIQVLGDTVQCIDITAQDLNYYDIMHLTADPLSEMFSVENPASFSDVSSTQFVNSPLCWRLTCDHVRDDPYLLDITLATERCFQTDTLEIPLELYVTTTSDGTIDLVPNVFTPNEDDINREWELVHIPDVCRTNERVRVFNRWGRLVFETQDLQRYWDGSIEGSPALEGEYYYLIDYLYFGEKMEYTGSVNIFR